MRYLSPGLMVAFAMVSFLSCGSDKGNNPQYRGTWQSTVGGEKSESAYSVIAAGNGDYVVAGETDGSGNGGDDMYIVRIDSTGKVLWEATNGGANDEVARSIEMAGDGGFLAFGRSTPVGATRGDLYLTKCTGSGSILWDKTYGGSDGEDGFAVRSVTGSDFLLAGSSGIAINTDFYIVKVDAQGNQIWDSKIKVLSLGSATGILTQETGASQVAGWALNISTGGWTDMILLWLDAQGNLITSGSYGGAKDEYCNAVVRTVDDGFLLAGWSTSNSGNGQDMYAVKVDAEGNEVWAKSYGGTGSDGANAVVGTPDGGYVLAGWTDSMGAGDVDAYLVKIDGNGTLVWQRTFGGADKDRAQAIAMADDGGLIVVGSTMSMGAGESDVYIIKTNANGEL